MKRNLFYFAASALVLAGCTSENVVEDVAKKNNAICFENVVNKVTRVDDITGDNLKQFNVFGFYVNPNDEFSAYEIFDDVLVTRDGLDWSYTDEEGNGLRYWLTGNKYYFYAYNCGNAEKLSSQYGTFSLDMDNSKELTAKERVLIINKYICDHTHQHDLIYASNVGGSNYEGIQALESGNAAVALQFRHILSKVNAKFTSKFPEEYKVFIKNVSFQNIRNVGNYHPVTGWQEVKRESEMPYINLSTTTTDEEGKPTNISIVNGTDKLGRQLSATTDTGVVIPWGYQGDSAEEGVDNKVYLTFDIEVTNQGKTVLTRSLKAILNPTWLPGYFYTYNIELSGSSTNMDAIIFTTATDEGGRVINWENEDITVGVEK